MEQRISLVTFGVEDLARARAFYEAMGWTGAQQPDDEIVFFQSGSMVFGLWTKLGGHGAPGIELAHNVRSPSEVDSVLSQAARAGGKVVRRGIRQSGAATPARSRIRMVTFGRSPTTLIGRLEKTVRYAFRSRDRCGRRKARGIGVGIRAVCAKRAEFLAWTGNVERRGRDLNSRWASDP